VKASCFHAIGRLEINVGADRKLSVLLNIIPNI
jgi:hypothetical protein